MWLLAVTAELLTVFDFRPAATVSFPQVDKPARPFTASPRPLPVCSANTPIPHAMEGIQPCVLLSLPI